MIFQIAETALAGEGVRRRLTAILAADVAGYSQLMGADEARTVSDLKVHQAVLFPMVSEFGGRIVDTAGDGILAEFASAVQAVECAVAIQKVMTERNAAIDQARRMQLRIGVNIGDVIYDEARIYGDGINVAARLEGIAEPGGICMSEDAYRQTRGKVDAEFTDIGEQSLKNIARPVRAYKVVLDGPSTLATRELPLPSKPSIAVLPFNNMSGDPEQEYFADGIVEEIITTLSRIHWLFVIARNSSFTYKSRAVDVKQVGRELGVRYVLEGGVRKAVSRVRITAQLIDAVTGVHLWADRFEGSLNDIFDLQDQVTMNVVGAIAPKLQEAEIQRAKHKPTESLDAYDYYLRGLGLAAIYRRTREGNDEALRLFYKAIERDPDFSSAYGMAAWCYTQRKACRWMTDRATETSEVARLARRVVELGEEDAVALAASAFALAYMLGDLDHGAALIDRALLLNTNLAVAWGWSGWVRTFLGEHGVALEHFAHSIRRSPLDPHMYTVQNGVALVHLLAGAYDKALSCGKTALLQNPDYHSALRTFAASNALAGRLEDAQKAIARLRAIDPTLRVSDLGELLPLRRPEDVARYAEGLRKAGLPE